MVCIQMIMCYIIKENKQFKNQWLTWSKKSVDVYMYFSFINLFFLWVYVFAGACAWMCTTCRIYICLYMTSHTKTHIWKLYTEKHSILMSMDSGNSNNYKNRAVDFHNFDWHNILPEPQKTFMCLFSRTRFALKVAFKRLYLALIAGIFIIILIKRKVHLPVNNGMLSTDALLIHAVTTVYFQYPTRREHWPQ